jgi:hypothetical protein
MHAGKALLLVLFGAAVVAAGVFTFVPSSRPPMVKKWFRHATGFAPAKTPTEAVDRFRDAIRKRDYETAAEFCDKDYREQMLKAAKQAKKLGDAIDSLLYNMDKNGVVNPKTKFTLRLLEPFPKTFKVLDIKEKDKVAVATIQDDDPLPKLDSPLPSDFYEKHRHMIWSLLPVEADLNLPVLELVKDDTGHWKIKLPVMTRLRVSVDHLKDNATNYANAILQVRDEVKNNPVTKEQVQRELETRLNQSK